MKRSRAETESRSGRVVVTSSRGILILALSVLTSLVASTVEAQDDSPFEASILRIPPANPADIIPVVVELRNVSASPVVVDNVLSDSIRWSTNAYSFVHEPPAAGNTSQRAPLDSGERARFIVGGLFPKRKKVKAGSYSVEDIHLTVQTDRTRYFKIAVFEPFSFEVEEGAAPWFSRDETGLSLPSYRPLLRSETDLQERVEESDVIALVDLTSVVPAPGGVDLSGSILKGIKGERTGGSVRVRARETLGCRWTIASGRYLAFLRRDTGTSLTPLDCQGALLPLERPRRAASSDQLPWVEATTHRHRRPANISDAIDELLELEAKTRARPHEMLEVPAALAGSRSPDAVVAMAPPAAFRHVPLEVREQLHAQGCLIPQPWTRPDAPLANVVAGEFAGAGQRDWAALCSKGRRSSVIVIWGGPIQCPSPLPRSEHSNYECARESTSSGPVVMGACRGLITLSRRDLQRPGAHEAVGVELGDATLASYYCNQGTWTREVGTR